MADVRSFKSVLITGASSGIGAALARTYADDGVHLHLIGRRETALTAVAAACRESGADCDEIIADVADADLMATVIAAIERRRPIDLVIANAGISAGTSDQGQTDGQIRAIFDINVSGVLNTVLPVLDPMAARGSGQIAIMSSLAGFRGLSGAPAYAASKAAVKSWGEGLRGALRERQVGVSVICPGFVESGITATNTFPMPFFMSADKAALIIKRGLARNRGRIAFPWPMVFAAWFLDSLPDSLASFLTDRLPAKEKTVPRG